MRVIGVTGGIGTGKSTVARLFGRLGARVLDADQVTHELMQPGTPVWRKIRSAFGDAVLTSSEEIDRKKLGARVFQDPKKLARLTRIIHPAVRRRFQQRLGAIRREEPDAVVVLDIPLLVESGRAYKVDALVVVSAPIGAAARRLKRRSGLTAAEIKRRSSFQLPLHEKERAADFVVKNGGSVAATRRQVARIWKQIVQRRKRNGSRKA